MKNQNTRLFLQTGADTALKSLGIRKDSYVFCLAFSCCLRRIQQFLLFQTSPKLWLLYQNMQRFVKFRGIELLAPERLAPAAWM
ncbi:hypothetical protein D3Z39_07415 [Anaerotruncus colihominis]|uniref:Uncharacterized protein n=1 Tax=Anaerotruncus colihominis TaxID=169435 RepID=A0A845RH04_9FIRM|nr:hypothetical protein [Anaerotruncus colihominis]